MPIPQQTRSKPRREPSKLPSQPPPPQEYQGRYEDYITSKRWERRKIAYYANHPKVCRACLGTERIHLHHHTYARMGHERDSDLVPLCERCHDLVHKLHRSGNRSLTAATRLFLQRCDADIDLPTRRPRSKKQNKPARIPRGQRKKRVREPTALPLPPVAVYGARDPGPEPMVRISDVVLEFRCTKGQLRHQGWQKKVPLSKVQQWRQKKPSWMRQAS